MSTGKSIMPLVDKLMSYWMQNPTVFHMPGHKLGKAYSPPNGDNLFHPYCPDINEILRTAALLDITEIPGSDNLYEPRDVIDQSMKLAAAAFGAETTFFLVNGSTIGIHAMLAATLKYGDRVLITRDCHKSVFVAIMQIGCKPIFVDVDYDDKMSIPLGVCPDYIAKAIDDYPDIKAVLITRPNYYGVCCDLEKIRVITKSQGIMLLVDEAHGAHLAFGKGILPSSAMDIGADICVQSAHKTLPAFNQAAFLHINMGASKKDFSRKIADYLKCMETSSPSYLIMATLDFARSYMELNGYNKLKEISNLLIDFKVRLEAETDFKVVYGNDYDKDCTRLVINTREIGLSTKEIVNRLRSFNIIPEMFDLKNIVFIVTCADDYNTLDRLFVSLRNIKGNSNISRNEQDYVRYKYPMFEEGILLRYEEYIHSERHYIQLENCVGCFSADFITPYPPGIPFVLPGQIINQRMVDTIFNWITEGILVNGVQSVDNTYVLVVMKGMV